MFEGRCVAIQPIPGEVPPLVDPNRPNVTDSNCIEIYAPVCALKDGQMREYGNRCFAERECVYMY